MNTRLCLINAEKGSITFRGNIREENPDLAQEAIKITQRVLDGIIEKERDKERKLFEKEALRGQRFSSAISGIYLFFNSYDVINNCSCLKLQMGSHGAIPILYAATPKKEKDLIDESIKISCAEMRRLDLIN